MLHMWLQQQHAAPEYMCPCGLPGYNGRHQYGFACMTAAAVRCMHAMPHTRHQHAATVTVTAIACSSNGSSAFTTQDLGVTHYLVL